MALTGENQPDLVPYLQGKAQEFDREEPAVTSGTGQLAEQFLSRVRQRVPQVQS